MPTPGNFAFQMEAENGLENEILDALTSSRHLKITLSQIARSYGVPTHEIEVLAQYLAKKVLRSDIEQIEFSATIKAIAEIEETITDPGLRAWKIQAIAKKAKRTYRELMECYNKALIHQGPIQPLSPAEFRLKAPTVQDWLIPGWIPRGTLLLLHGDGGTGKTLFGYQLINSVLRGESWNGYEVAQGRCLLVQCDEPEIVLRSRLDLLQIPDDAPLDILSDWTVDGIARLSTYLEEKRPEFVLIDSLSAINTSTIFSENDTEYARPILQLTKLCSQFNCTIVLVHHSNANGQARGSRAIHNSASEVWHLRIGDNQDERVLTVNKTRLGREPGSYRFAFDPETYTFNYEGDASDQDGASVTQEEKIRLWMQQDDNRGVRYTSTEVAEFCAISKPACRRALAELWSRGILKRDAAKGSKRGFVYWASPREECNEPLQECDQSGHAITSDQGVIASRDRMQNADTEPDTASSDQAITKKSKNRSEKNSRKPDRLIASRQNADTEPVSDAITHAIRGLTPDRIDQDGEAAILTIDESLIGVEVEILRKGNLLGRRATVAAISNGIATLTHPTWAIEPKFRLEELQRCE